MGVAERKAASQNMAAMMKQNGTERQTGRCPICYGGLTIGPPQANTEGMLLHMLPGNCPGHKRDKPAVRKGSNGSDFFESIRRYNGDRGLIYADMLGQGWSRGRIKRFFDRWDNIKPGA